MSLLTVKNVKKVYTTRLGGNKVQALDNVNFTVEQGEYVAIMGESGSGKSTLLNLIMKQEYVTSGQIIVEGRRLDTMDAKRVPLHRRRLGIMSPEVGLLKDRSIYDNIRLAILATGNADVRIRSKVIKVLGLVLLSRALAVQPEILIADEPTANLDPDSAWDLMQLFDELNYRGMTILVASHARELVTIMKKRCITLVAGRLAVDARRSIYDQKAMDIFAERRILEEEEKKSEKMLYLPDNVR